MKKILAVLLLAACSALGQEVSTFPPGSSGGTPFTGGTITAPLLGPTGCATPAYSFTGAATYGLCSASGTSVTAQAGTAPGRGLTTWGGASAATFYQDAGGNLTTFTVGDNTITGVLESGANFAYTPGSFLNTLTNGTETLNYSRLADKVEHALLDVSGNISTFTQELSNMSLYVYSYGGTPLPNLNLRVYNYSSGVDSYLNVSDSGTKVYTAGAKPACSSAAAVFGRIWRTEGGGGVADTFELCAKNAANAYAWTSMLSAGPLALDGLSDVNAAAPADEEVLTWDSGTSRWIAAPTTPTFPLQASVDAAEYSFTSNAGAGFGFVGGVGPAVFSSAAGRVAFEGTTGRILTTSAGGLNWGSGGTVSASVDTGLARDSAGVVRHTNGGSGLGYSIGGVSVEANTGTKNATTVESGELYTNTGDADGSTINLPNDPTIGTTYTVTATVAQDITLAPAAGETIMFGNTVCGTSFVIGGAATGIGDSVTVVAATGGSGAVWITTASAGTPVCTP